MQTPKQKAEELIKKFAPFVFPYMGSGMLNNETNDYVILSNAKQCAFIVVNEASSSHNKTWARDYARYEFWKEVSLEINKLTELPK